MAVRQDTALRLAQGPAARLLGLLGLLWPLGLLLLLVMLLLLIRAMSICTTAAPTTSVLGATTTRASAIPCHDDHAPPGGQEGPSSAQSSMPSASQVTTCKLGQVELEWFP